MRRPTLPPSLPALRTFLEAARVESFTRAAKALFVTQGAVSRQIRALEGDLDTPLFTRTRRTVRLTPAGRAYLVEVERAFGILERATAALVRGSARVVVSLLPSFATMWLMPRLPRFEELHPDVRIELRPAYELVDPNDVDVAIRYGQGAYPGTVTRRVLSETLVPVASPTVARKLRGGSFWHLPMLSAGALDEDDRHDLDWRAWSVGAGVPLPKEAPYRRLRDYQRVVHAARAGQGVAIGRMHLVGALVRDGVLVAVAPEQVTGRTGHFFVCREAAWEFSAVQTFHRWLRSQARAPRA